MKWIRDKNGMMIQESEPEDELEKISISGSELCDLISNKKVIIKGEYGTEKFLLVIED